MKNLVNIRKFTKINAVRKIGLFSVIMMLGMTAFSFADMIMPNTHPVDRCVKIVENPDLQNQDITLRAKITGPIVELDQEDYIIKYDTCLSAGYKLNSFNVILQKDEQEYDLGMLETWGGRVDDSNPVVAEKEYYQVVLSGNIFVLGKTYEEQTLEDNTVKVLFDIDQEKKQEEKNGEEDSEKNIENEGQGSENIFVRFWNWLLDLF